jgi:hypothetical protein
MISALIVSLSLVTVVRGIFDTWLVVKYPNNVGVAPNRLKWERLKEVYVAAKPHAIARFVAKHSLVCLGAVAVSGKFNLGS